jgi:hypothetical protein
VQITHHQFDWRTKRCGSVLRIKNALRGRIFPTLLGYSRIRICHIFIYHRERKIG